jgi:hypothetical protein
MSPSGKKSPYRHADEVADVVVAALILNRAVMEKTIPHPAPSPSPELEEEEINLQYKKNMA